MKALCQEVTQDPKLYLVHELTGWLVKWLVLLSLLKSTAGNLLGFVWCSLVITVRLYVIAFDQDHHLNEVCILQFKV